VTWFTENAPQARGSFAARLRRKPGITPRKVPRTFRRRRASKTRRERRARDGVRAFFMRGG